TNRQHTSNSFSIRLVRSPTKQLNASFGGNMISNSSKWWPRATLSALMAALALISVPASSLASDDDGGPQNTATPIKHVIVIIGENRTFDHIYATYEPKHGSVSNLLSRGIVKSDGSPGPNANLARQFQLKNINPVSYFIDTRKLINSGKTAYS